MEMLAAVLVLAQSVAATPSPVPPTLTPVPTTAASPASPPSAARKLSGGFGRKQKAPGKTKVVLTDEALTPSRKTGTFSVSGTRTPAKAEIPVDGSETPAKADDESTWKARVATLRVELAQAEKEYDVADRANTVIAFGEVGDEYHRMMAIRNAALTPYRIKLDELRSAFAALPEECRRAPGCQPGWVR
ncbi:MAG TPA: hypothetical protein PLP50_16260 [Thermoanaerobaculia bacterium]|nr:hypothetical protein [Thermoanaerobaculia bacterium]HQN09978.1 hypothetical protein [Thermoanaerobaculia bacterium]HQP89022.1 hypothetical protein [Thermoanaerobaculia bacterium]